MASSSHLIMSPPTTTPSSSFIVVVVLLLLIVIASTTIHTSAVAAASAATENENNNDITTSNNPSSSSFSSAMMMKSQQYHHHPPLLSSSSSSSQLPSSLVTTSPASHQHFHDAFMNRLLLTANRFATTTSGGGDNDNDDLLRNLQQEGEGDDDDDDDICTNDPFLWSIHRRSSPQDEGTTDDESQNNKNNDNEILGFGIGTIHFPIQYIMVDEAFHKIRYAIEDSCYVYGEIDLLNEQLLDELQTCSIEIGSEGTIYLADIKDFPSITNQISIGISEILDEYIVVANQRPTIQQILEDTLPIWILIQFIQVYKTQNSLYKDSYFQSQFVTGILEPIMDYTILEMKGQWSSGYTGSIETIDTQCTYLDMASPNITEFWNNYENHYKLIIEHSLNTSGYTSLFDFYKCGNLQQLTNWLNDASIISGSELEYNINQYLFDERNIQMGEFIVDKLNNNNNNNNNVQPPSVFAVGFGHWVYGEYNLIDYLEENGYTLQRITISEGDGNYYNQDTYPNMSNEICDIRYLPITSSPTAAPTTTPTTTTSTTTTTTNTNTNTEDDISISGDTTTGTTTTTTATNNNKEEPNDKSSSSSASGPFDCYSHHQAIISGIIITPFLFQNFA